MKISVYGMSVETFVPMLRSLSNILDKGAEHAGAKKLEATALVNARLAPDMYTLAQQVQLACDQARGAAARLTRHEPARVEHNERSLEELKALIAETIVYLEKPRPAEFEGAEDRKITIPIPDNMEIEMNGAQFLRDWAIPHFYFHVVTAYDILRHNGVEIGKRDYLSHVGSYIRQRGNPS